MEIEIDAFDKFFKFGWWKIDNKKYKLKTQLEKLLLHVNKNTFY